MYADDTTLFCNFDNIRNENTINNEINKVYDWLCSNKFIEVETRDARSINNFVNELKDLKIYDQLDKQLTNDPNANYKLFNDFLNNARAKHLPKKRVKYKTKYMCFHKSNKTVTYPKLKINNVTIDRVNDFKFLGLIISLNLKWNKHINHISIKVSKVIGIMFRLRTILPSDVLQTLYNSLIMPHFHYCLLTWGSTIKTGHKIHLLQKKALRLIYKSHYIAHTEPIFKKLHMVKIIDMFSIAV